MSARALFDEYERVIVRGKQTSLAHGTPVSMTYRFILIDAHFAAFTLTHGPVGQARDQLLRRQGAVRRTHLR
jgi:hypothetical protein